MEVVMRNIWQDLRVAIRILYRNPGFAAVIIVTLALGIGLNTSVFTIFDAVALRPLPVRDPERVVKVYQRIVGESGYRSFSYPEYTALRESSSSFSEVIAHAWMPLEMRSEAAGDGVAHLPVQVLLVSDNYLSG